MLALLLVTTLAAPRDDDPLRAWVRRELERQHIPGMAVGVYRYGKPVEIVTDGYAQIQLTQPVTHDTVFEICSVTKQFTAVAILLLAQEGKLSLDDKLIRFFPSALSPYGSITIRQLLTHTSGVPDRMFRDKFISDSVANDLRRLFSMPLDFRSGSRWRYDNTGYWILGHVLEKVSGTGYFDFLQDRIFTPLGMTHTGPNRMPSQFHEMATGYQIVNGKAVIGQSLDADEGYSVGGLVSTLDDLNIWSQALMTGKLLTKANRKLMTTPVRLSSGEKAWTAGAGGYGFGVFLGTVNGHPYEMHTGAYNDSSCQLCHFERDGMTIVVLTNAGQAKSRAYWADQIAHFFVPSITPPNWIPKKDPAPSLTESAKQFLRRIASSRKVDDLATPYMIDHDLEVGTDYATYFSSLGPLKSFSFVGETKQGNTSVHTYRASFDKVIVVSFTFAKDGKVDELNYLEPPMELGQSK